jgi:hypothetical protein
MDTSGESDASDAPEEAMGERFILVRV